MKQVIIFTEPVWAFGIIHYELCKYLWPYGINAQVRPWNLPYTLDEMNNMIDSVDYIITSSGSRRLFHQYLDKLIIVLHGKTDIYEILENFNHEEINKLKGFYALSEGLVEEAKLVGMLRLPDRLRVGINYSTYYTPSISSSLMTIGYAGAAAKVSLKQDPYNVSLKRPYLVKAIASIANKPLVCAQSYINHFTSMRSFYSKVDMVINCAMNEGAGLPVLEASAAGKLVMSTPVGHWEERCLGITLPFPDRDLVNKALEEIKIYEDPVLYKYKCLEIQEHAKSYDWSNVIQQWVEIFK